MLRNRIVYLAVVLILLLFRVAYTGYVAGMLLVIALILPVFSWLISLPGAIYTHVSLSVPDQITRGTDVSVRFAIRQSRLFSTGTIRGKLWVSSVVDGKVTKAKLKSATGTFALDTSHCCQYECRLKGFRILDLMGLLPMPARRVPPIYVTVLPIPEEPADHPDWSASSAVINKPFSGGGNPYDLRDYRVGDTMRSIHWKKSAALDKTVVRDTLEPAERVASIWIDWPQDPAGRDLALDQLSWCIIYLNQNNAGILLHWLDSAGREQHIFAPQGEIDSVLPRMLSQKAGCRCSPALLRPREILLSAGIGGEVRS